MKEKNSFLRILVLSALFLLWAAEFSISKSLKMENNFSSKILKKNTGMEMIEDEVTMFMKKLFIPGLAIAVIQNGELVFKKNFGVKDINTLEAITDDTIFESASTGKAIFAYAVMKLVERDLLKLDKPLIEYAPKSYLKKIWKEYNTEDKRFDTITARMCLSHTTGFPNWLKDKLYFKTDPGKKWIYSGSGYVFLGTVVEKIMSIPLDRFIYLEVLKPLKMRKSWFCWMDKFKGRTSSWHDSFGKKSKKHIYIKPLAAGSLYTTTDDFAKFLLALINENELGKVALKEMQKPYAQVEIGQSKKNNLFWGLGLGVYKTGNSVIYWHHGDNGNYKAYFEIDKRNRSGIIFYANSKNGLSIADRIIQLFSGRKRSAVGLLGTYLQFNK